MKSAKVPSLARFLQSKSSLINTQLPLGVIRLPVRLNPFKGLRRPSTALPGAQATEGATEVPLLVRSSAAGAMASTLGLLFSALLALATASTACGKPTIPAPPGNLTATAVSSNQINLNWSD